MVLISGEEASKLPRHLKIRSIDHLCGCGCGKIIEHHEYGSYSFKGQPVTSDCYFDAMSKHFDKHPIITPKDVA